MRSRDSVARPPVGLISVDVEEWFHVLDTAALPPYAEWDSLCVRAPRNVLRILDIFSATHAQATFFVVGWVARRHPWLVKEIHARGHEIASHSDRHALLDRLPRAQVMEDLYAGRAALEALTGEPVRGFRAPGFCIHQSDGWLLDCIAEAGFLYDSSLCPARRPHGGRPGGRMEPHLLCTSSGSTLAEVPPSAIRLLGSSMPFGGGGYLRVMPLCLTHALGVVAAAQGRPFVGYLHPRDIDPDSPRLRVGRVRALRLHAGAGGTARKLRALLQWFPNTTYAQYLAEHGLLPGSPFRAALLHGPTIPME